MLVSCTNDDFMLYNGEDGLQFGPSAEYIYRTDYQLRDTLKSYTFVYEPVGKVQDTVFFNIYTMGRVSGEDRPFELRQVAIPGTDNAVAGVHYKSFDDPSLQSYYVIKAGAASAKVPVVVLRDPSLKTKNYSLKLEIVENDFFKLGEKNKIWRKVTLGDRLIRPNAWTAFVETRYFGKYSYVKHQWLVQQTGQKWDDAFMTPVLAETAEVTYWTSKVKKLLSDYNSNPANPGVPLTDEFGELVKFI